MAARCSQWISYPAPSEPPYLVEPAETLDDLETARRSGIAVLDAVIDALQTGDSEALAGLVDYEPMACLEHAAIGGPPVCAEDEPRGTIVGGFPVAGCEGYYRRRDQVAEVWRGFLTAPQNTTQEWRLYGAAETDAERFGWRGSYLVIIAGTESIGGPANTDIPASIAIFFTDAGMTGLLTGCGPEHPQSRLERYLEPTFLLPPP